MYSMLRLMQGSVNLVVVLAIIVQVALGLPHITSQFESQLSQLHDGHHSKQQHQATPIINTDLSSFPGDDSISGRIATDDDPVDDTTNDVDADVNDHKINDGPAPVKGNNQIANMSAAPIEMLCLEKLALALDGMVNGVLNALKNDPKSTKVRVEAEICTDAEYAKVGMEASHEDSKNALIGPLERLEALAIAALPLGNLIEQKHIQHHDPATNALIESHYVKMTFNTRMKPSQSTVYETPAARLAKSIAEEAKSVREALLAAEDKQALTDDVILPALKLLDMGSERTDDSTAAIDPRPETLIFFLFIIHLTILLTF